MMSDTISDWMSTSEAARWTGYDKEYIRQLCRDGKIESRKFDRATMISKDSLKEYLKKQGKELKGE